MHHRPVHRPRPDLLLPVSRRDPINIEPSVNGFKRGVGNDYLSYGRRRAMLHMDGGADGNFSGTAKWLLRHKTGMFHKGDHVWSGKNRGQQLIVSGQCVLVLDDDFHFSPRTDRDGLCHIP